MTTYKATAERQGRFWVVRIDGLPVGEQNVTQGLTWTEAHENARELVSLVLDVEDDPAAYTVDLVPADPAMFEVVREADQADTAVQEAEKRRRVARTALTQEGPRSPHRRETNAARESPRKRVSPGQNDSAWGRPVGRVGLEPTADGL